MNFPGVFNLIFCFHYQRHLATKNTTVEIGIALKMLNRLSQILVVCSSISQLLVRAVGQKDLLVVVAVYGKRTCLLHKLLQVLFEVLYQL